jgi:hypothetical protein
LLERLHHLDAEWVTQVRYFTTRINTAELSATYPRTDTVLAAACIDMVS